MRISAGRVFQRGCHTEGSVAKGVKFGVRDGELMCA